MTTYYIDLTLSEVILAVKIYKYTRHAVKIAQVLFRKYRVAYNMLCIDTFSTAYRDHMRPRAITAIQ